MKAYLLLSLLLVTFASNAQTECATVLWEKDYNSKYTSLQQYILSMRNVCAQKIVVTVKHPGGNLIDHPDGIVTHSFTLNPREILTHKCPVNKPVGRDEIRYTVEKVNPVSKSTDAAICTLYVTLRLPIDLASNGVKCESTGGIACAEVANILLNPIAYWEGTVNDCKLGIQKYRDRNYVDATITIIGLKSLAQDLYDKLIPSSK